MVQIRENYLKVAQDIFWSQKLCFDERRLFFFFFFFGFHATWVSENKFRTSLFLRLTAILYFVSTITIAVVKRF